MSKHFWNRFKEFIKGTQKTPAHAGGQEAAPDLQRGIKKRNLKNEPIFKTASPLNAYQHPASGMVIIFNQSQVQAFENGELRWQYLPRNSLSRSDALCKNPLTEIDIGFLEDKFLIFFLEELHVYEEHGGGHISHMPVLHIEAIGQNNQPLYAHHLAITGGLNGYDGWVSQLSRQVIHYHIGGKTVITVMVEFPPKLIRMLPEPSLYQCAISYFYIEWDGKKLDQKFQVDLPLYHKGSQAIVDPQGNFCLVAYHQIIHEQNMENAGIGPIQPLMQFFNPRGENLWSTPLLPLQKHPAKTRLIIWKLMELTDQSLLLLCEENFAENQDGSAYQGDVGKYPLYPARGMPRKIRYDLAHQSLIGIIIDKQGREIQRFPVLQDEDVARLYIEADNRLQPVVLKTYLDGADLIISLHHPDEEIFRSELPYRVISGQSIPDFLSIPELRKMAGQKNSLREVPCVFIIPFPALG